MRCWSPHRSSLSAAIALACAGRLRALDASEHAAGRACCRQSEYRRRFRALEPALSLVFTDPPDAPVCRARLSFDFYLNIAKAAGRCRMSARSPVRARKRVRGARGRPLIDLVAARGSETLVYRSDARGLQDQRAPVRSPLRSRLSHRLVRVAAAQRQERRADPRDRASSDRDRFRGDPRQARSAAGHLPGRDAMSRASCSASPS